jgi:hypothetical protein
MKISKSKFMAGAQCYKRLYFQVHQPELAAEPDASAFALMEQGHEPAGSPARIRCTASSLNSLVNFLRDPIQFPLSLHFRA